MQPRLSALWLSIGTAFLATTVDAACASPSLCALNTLAYTHKRFWGTCVTFPMPDSQYLSLASNFNEFGMVTPINYGFDFSTIEPNRGVFGFTKSDQAMNHWLSRTPARLWIHSLLPITGLPTWLTNGSWTQATLTSVIQNHIATVAGRYKGKIYAWDVVSEIFNDDGSWRTNVFYNTLGSSYVTIALKAARAADANAKLYIEEYGAETVNAKSVALWVLVQQLKINVVPLDGIGFEGQVSAVSPPNVDSMTLNVSKCGPLNLDWAFTQLGVRIGNGGGNEAQQSSAYLAMVSVCLNSPRCVGISTSGIKDGFTIQGAGISGGPTWTETLFHGSYQTIPAYYGIADSLTTAIIDGHYW